VNTQPFPDYENNGRIWFQQPTTAQLHFSLLPDTRCANYTRCANSRPPQSPALQVESCFGSITPRQETEKHGGGLQRHDAAESFIAAPQPAEDLVALDEALTKLAALDPVKAELVQLRYFAGLTIEQAAATLNISPATAKRYWAYSRAWLFQAVSGAE
jgi:DNA-directed RNA polymerase specialized sigma24 family protein